MHVRAVWAQLSAWRSFARQGKLAVASSAEPEPVVDGCEPELAFATLEVDSATVRLRRRSGLPVNHFRFLALLFDIRPERPDKVVRNR